jgi:hypothetical protein
VRLAALVPIEHADNVPPANDGNVVVWNSLFSGRYLLHVYQGDPETLVAFTRNETQGGHAGDRIWLRRLVAAGEQEITDFELENEGESFLKPITKALRPLTLRFNVTNYVVKPVVVAGGNQLVYWCILTRIDSFRIAFAGQTWEVSAARQGRESMAGAYEHIRDTVGRHVHLSTADEPPPKGAAPVALDDNGGAEPAAAI